MPVAEKAVEQVRDFHRGAASAIADVFEDGIQMTKRVGKSASDATEELMDDSVNRIKRHPVESIVTAFAIGFIIGGFVDWLTRRQRYF